MIGLRLSLFLNIEFDSAFIFRTIILKYYLIRPLNVCFIYLICNLVMICEHQSAIDYIQLNEYSNWIILFKFSSMQHYNLFCFKIKLGCHVCCTVVCVG
jgi:hypothetical protein